MPITIRPDIYEKHRSLFGDFLQFCPLLSVQMLVFIEHIIADRSGLGLAVQNTLHRGDISGSVKHVTFAEELFGIGFG